jgi:hypothetical protein
MIPKEYIFSSEQAQFLITTKYFFHRFAIHFANKAVEMPGQNDAGVWGLDVKFIMEDWQPEQVAQYIFSVQRRVKLGPNSITDDPLAPATWKDDWDELARFVVNAIDKLRFEDGHCIPKFLKRVETYSTASLLDDESATSAFKTLKDVETGRKVRKLYGLEQAANIHQYEISLRSACMNDGTLSPQGSQQYV